jgi:hypothetical protein
MMVPVVLVEVRAEPKPQEEQEAQRCHPPAVQVVSRTVAIHQPHLVTWVVVTAEAAAADTMAVAVHQEVVVAAGHPSLQT